jgi:hypothetical protein
LQPRSQTEASGAVNIAFDEGTLSFKSPCTVTILYCVQKREECIFFYMWHGACLSDIFIYSTVNFHHSAIQLLYSIQYEFHCGIRLHNVVSYSSFPSRLSNPRRTSKVSKSIESLDTGVLFKGASLEMF